MGTICTFSVIILPIEPICSNAFLSHPLKYYLLKYSIYRRQMSSDKIPNRFQVGQELQISLNGFPDTTRNH